MLPILALFFASNPLVACGLIAYALMNLVKIVKVDAERAKQGLDPPSVDLAKRLLERRGGKARGGGPAKPPKRPGMSGYLWERWLDMWEDATNEYRDHREQQQKDRARQAETGRPAPDRPSLRERLRGRPDAPGNTDPGGSRKPVRVCEWCEDETGDLQSVRYLNLVWLLGPACRADLLGTPAGHHPDPADDGQDTGPGVVHDDEPYRPTDNTRCPGCNVPATRSPAAVAEHAAEWRCWESSCGDTCGTCGEHIFWARPARPGGAWRLRHSTALGHCPGPKPAPAPTAHPHSYCPICHYQRIPAAEPGFPAVCPNGHDDSDPTGRHRATDDPGPDQQHDNQEEPVTDTATEVNNNEDARRAFAEMRKAAAEAAEAIAMLESARAKMAAIAQSAVDGMGAKRFDAAATAAAGDAAAAISVGTLNEWAGLVDTFDEAATTGLRELEKYRDSEAVVAENRIDASTLASTSA